MNKLAISFSVLVLSVFSTVAQTKEQLKTVTQVYKIMEEKGGGHAFEGEEAELFKKMTYDAFDAALAEIKQEAKEAGKRFEWYADSDESMEMFNKKLASLEKKIDSLSKPQLLWILTKSGQRIQIHSKAKVWPENFEKNVAIAQSILKKMMDKLGL